MAIGPAQAGCDIVGINVVEPLETAGKIEETGRRFLSLKADLSKQDGIPALLEKRSPNSGISIFWSTTPGLSAAKMRWRSAKRLGRRDEYQQQNGILYVAGGGASVY